MALFRNTRRRCLAMLAIATCLGACAPVNSALKPSPGLERTAMRPNILFVLVDDMGFADPSVTGNTKVITPNMDRLAREGLLLTQFYDAAPICSPSRAAFITGQFPAKNRFVTYIAHRQRNTRFGQADWLDPKLDMLPRALKQVGYATGHFGKWHLGGGRDVGEAPLPSEYGFDISYTQFEGLGPRVLPSGLPGDLAVQSERLGKGPIDWLPRADMTARFVDRTLAFIRAQKDRPWFAQLWLDDVHTPWMPDNEQIALVQGDGRSAEEDRFHAVLVAMDAQIGRLVDTLRAEGELDDTIIVLTSDNGPTIGANTAGSAAPFRGRKASLYEGGIRQPLFVRWPGHVPAGRRDDTTVAQAVDLFPTLASIAGAVGPAKGDGVDIGAAWLGVPIKGRPDVFAHIARPASEAFGPLYSIRSGPWKLLANADGTGAELYNIVNDPSERTDRLTGEPAVATGLMGRLNSWIRSLPTPGPAVGR